MTIACLSGKGHGKNIETLALDFFGPMHFNCVILDKELVLNMPFKNSYTFVVD